MPRTLALALLLVLALPGTAAAALKARGSVEQVHVTGAKRGAKLTLIDRSGRTRDTQRAGKLGGAVFRNVKPGRYRVQRQARPRALRPLGAALDASATARSIPQERLRLPDHARRHEARHQRAPARAGRARTRRWSSTRATATPTRPGRRARSARSPTCSATRWSTSTCAAPAARAARSTTSSRSRPSTATTSIETVARQPWAARGKVGMVGVSYGGISQLFVAADAAAEPGRDHAAVGDRQHADDAVSGRHPQHRLRARVGEGPRRTTPSRRRRPAASRGRSSASRTATRPARPTRRCTPRRST